MSTNARNTDPSTSHQGLGKTAAADRAQVRFYHIENTIRGLTDFELDDLCGGHQNGRWRKRRCDLTIGSAAQGEKILIAAKDCRGWKGDLKRQNSRTGKWQLVWVLAELSKPEEITKVSHTDNYGLFDV
jgi:hypothetical protein